MSKFNYFKSMLKKKKYFLLEYFYISVSFKLRQEAL
jgi:hypothetical protein